MIYFKFPFDENFYTLKLTTSKSNLCFFPFKGGEIISFEGEVSIESNVDISNEILGNLDLNEVNKEESKEEYIQNLEQIISIIKENKLPKIVYSRRKITNFDKALNLKKTFENLCNSYPNAFRYIFEKDGICWMGAFSELLGKYDKQTGNFQTMSLAGTLPVNEEWSKKEIEEQKPVTDFIAQTLEKYAENIKISETYDHISGNIKHLRTDFSANISSENLDKIISELHPTPAVCGIPKDFCTNIIEEFEKYPRELYSGYTKIETEKEVQYFVNLRCAKIFKNSIHAFVGGGITAESNPEKEWRETELKSQAILGNLSF